MRDKNGLRRNHEAELTIMSHAYDEARAEVERLSVAATILQKLVAEAKSDGCYLVEDNRVVIEASWVTLTEAEIAYLRAAVAGTETQP